MVQENPYGGSQSIDARTAHSRSWCKLVRSSRDGTRTSRPCGMRPWMRPISENRRGWRVHGSHVFICCRGTWHKSRWGRRRQGVEPFHRKPKSSNSFFFLHNLGKYHHWLMLCMQEFAAMNGEVVTETSEGHQVFATPPCQGVCWQEKKFRVICSHLSPSSVVHLHAKDLDDFRSLVTSRGRDMQVHVCVVARSHIVSRSKECSRVSSWKSAHCHKHLPF